MITPIRRIMYTQKRKIFTCGTAYVRLVRPPTKGGQFPLFPISRLLGRLPTKGGQFPLFPISRLLGRLPACPDRCATPQVDWYTTCSTAPLPKPTCSDPTPTSPR